MGNPEKSGSLLRAGESFEARAAFEFVKREKAAHPVSQLCRVLGVSSSGFYAWQDRPLSARAQAGAALKEQIQTIFTRSRRTYGAPRVQAELRALGVRCGRKRVARLMRAAGLVGAHRRRPPRTTWRDSGRSPSAGSGAAAV